MLKIWRNKRQNWKEVSDKVSGELIIVNFNNVDYIANNGHKGSVLFYVDSSHIEIEESYNDVKRLIGLKKSLTEFGEATQ